MKPGTKPSHLKKLKRSKSADDIPQAPPLPLTNSEVAQLKKSTDLTTLLQEQLKEKQQEIESLKKEKELVLTPANPTETLVELDHSLITRHKSLKDWFIQYSQNKHLEQELAENIEQVSEELISQDKTISHLRSQVSKLKQEKQSLTWDLELTSRLAQSRKVPYYSPSDYPDPYQQLKYALYSLGAMLFTLWLMNSCKNKKNYA